jgi:DNA-directed RNA polymerase sigma subunit (sigma70/sigma32)
MSDPATNRTPTGKRRFGNKNAGTAQMSLQEIGDLFGVTLQSIQAVEKRAIKKIKHAIETSAAAEGKTVGEWLFGE